MQKSNNLANMLIGGTAGTIALFFVYPIESVKTVLQMRSEARVKARFFDTASERIRAEGFGSLYRGLPAAIWRQFLFASLRLGLYFNYSDMMKAQSKTHTISAVQSALGSLVAGAVSCCFVMPFDVIYVRFQADNAMPVSQRRGYKGLMDALRRITKEEGAGTLWRGLNAGVCRAMALNLGTLVPYEKCKAMFAPYLGWSKKNYFLSAAIAGIGATCCALPFDNAKVKIQKMRPGPDGKMPYLGLFDCLQKSVRNEGLLRLWTGFGAIYMIAAPHVMIMLSISEALRTILGISKN